MVEYVVNNLSTIGVLIYLNYPVIYLKALQYFLFLNYLCHFHQTGRNKWHWNCLINKFN